MHHPYVPGINITLHYYNKPISYYYYDFASTLQNGVTGNLVGLCFETTIIQLLQQNPTELFMYLCCVASNRSCKKYNTE